MSSPPAELASESRSGRKAANDSIGGEVSPEGVMMMIPLVMNSSSSSSLSSSSGNQETETAGQSRPPALLPPMPPSTGTKVTERAPSPNSVAMMMNMNNNNNNNIIPGRNDFYWSDEPEPHAARRKAILAKYPQVQSLFGHDPNAKYTVLLLMTIQFTIAYLFRAGPPDAAASTLSSSLTRNGWWALLFATAYIIGGTCNHMLMLSMHEMSHNLFFRQPRHNRWFSMLANLPLAVPSAISFKIYHTEHHKYQGHDTIDVDIPTHWEGRNIANYTLYKFLFLVFQIFFYALRPLLVRPKPMTRLEAINIALCLTFDAAVVYTWGIWSLIYLLLSSWLGAGLHPVAGHFIAEHYVFVPGFETYSYYGPWNILAFNVGYHNEHHDFPNIPGSRLPLLRQMAPEFYDSLPTCDSWIGILFQYLTDPTMTPYGRIKRYPVMTTTKTDAGSLPCKTTSSTTTTTGLLKEE